MTHQQLPKIFIILIITLIISSALSNPRKKELKPFFDEADLISQNHNKASKSTEHQKLNSSKNLPEKSNSTSKEKIAKLLKTLLSKDGIKSLNSSTSKTLLSFLKSSKNKSHALKQKKIFDENRKNFEIHEQDTKDLSKQVSELNRKMFLASAKIEELKIKGND